MGTQYPADLGVAPPGYVNIKQYNQRSTNSLGNTAKASFVSIAKVFGNLRKNNNFQFTFIFQIVSAVKAAFPSKQRMEIASQLLKASWKRTG